jgi:phenylpropionate dioxygenase-like ring-hydroxylating dioxygenase large terminal subunit
MTSFVANPALRRYWWAVARSEDVDEPIAAQPLGQPVVVWRSGGVLRAALDRCPHREAPLSLGSVDQQGCLVCSYHGWKFDGGGACVEIPSQRPHVAITSRARLESILVVERYGLVWICLDEPVAGIVDVAEVAQPEYRTISCPGYVWNVSATRLADNFLDSSHFAFLHRPSFGADIDPVYDPIEVVADERTVSYRYAFKASNPAFAQITTGQAVPTLTRTMTFSITVPFTLLSRIDYESGLRHVIFNAITPESDTKTRWFMVLVRNDDHNIPPMEAVTLDLKIVEEDRALLESIPGPLPLDLPSLVHVGADRPSVEWIRRFRRVLGLES